MGEVAKNTARQRMRGKDSVRRSFRKSWNRMEAVASGLPSEQMRLPAGG